MDLILSFYPFIFMNIKSSKILAKIDEEIEKLIESEDFTSEELDEDLLKELEYTWGTLKGQWGDTYSS